MSYKRKQKEKHILKKLADKGPSWTGGAYYDEFKHRYVRYWIGSRSKYWKRKCNRKVRRMKNIEGKGNSYRKMTEYRWEIW